jgi:uncharacterized protein
VPDRDDRVVEDMIAHAAPLLDEIEGVHRRVSGSLDDLAARVQEEARREGSEGVKRSLGLVANGWLEIEVARDEMSSVAHVHPPTEGGDAVTIDEVREALGKRGVTFGIDWSAAELAVLKCTMKREEVPNVVVARGAAAKDPLPERLVIEPQLLASPPDEPEGARVDHRARSPFRFVKKGQVLARKVPPAAGAPGSTVTGRFLPFKASRSASLAAGESTEVVGDSLVAACDGRLVHDERTVSVSRVLEIRGDVDYHTGNVDFQGDVVVEGRIKDGFTVKATASILCGNTVGAADVSADGDVILEKGFLGRDRGIVHAGKGFDARFVENGRVEAQGPVWIEVGAINSTIHTLGVLTAGAKAVIVGGTIVAADGVDAMHLGSRMEVRTEIHCGINYLVMQKLEWVQFSLMQLSKRIQEVEHVKASGKGNPRTLADFEGKLRDAVTKMNQTAMSLIPGLDKNESATVVARGTVYPGVYIEICHMPFIVQRELSMVRFSLDKAQGKVVVKRFEP